MAQHGIKEHSHGAGIPIQTRNERPRSSSVSDFAEVSKLENVWKYLPLDKLRGLDAEVMAEVNEVGLELATGVSAEWVASSEVKGFALPEDRVSAAAWTNASKTLVVTVSGEVAEPSFLRISEIASASALHILIRSEAHATGTVVVDHTGFGILAENIEIDLGAGSSLNVVSIQDWAAGSTHVSSQFARLGRDSKLKHTVVSIGGEVVRVTPSVELSEPGAEVHLYGVYLADSGQFLEHRPFVDHIAPNCVSRVAYKGALQGAGAHTVWIGDVLIRETAVGTDSYELNRNLLLSSGARADSVPNLEIETGKIQGAGHASASGRFDDEQLFYLQSRGIGETEARRLVVRGFLNEVIQKIAVAEIENRMMSAIDNELDRKGA
jgi:Fe-S cluster assembly protein SufD